VEGEENKRVAKETYDMLTDLLVNNKKPQQSNTEHPLNTMKVSALLKPKEAKNILAGNSKMAGFRNKLYKASTTLNKDVLSNMKNRMAKDEGVKNKEIIGIVGEESADEEFDSDGNPV